MRIACVTCGDHNVLYPSIITHDSIRKFNNDFEHYIFFAGENIQNELNKVLDPYNIKPIVADSEITKQLDNYSGFARYSKFLFLRYIIPDYFSSLGYDYMIDVDYDIFCQGNYQITNILPYDTIFSYRPVNKIKDVISEEDQKFIKNEFNIPSTEKFESKYPHGGFVIINLKLYKNTNFSKVYLEVYKKICHLIVNCPINELVFGLTNIIINTKPLYIDRNYNSSFLYENCFEKPINVHFASFIKPWNVDEWLKNNNFINNNQLPFLIYYIYILKYIDFSKHYTFYDKIFKNKHIEYTLMKYLFNWDYEILNKKISHGFTSLDNAYTKDYYKNLLQSSKNFAFVLIPLLNNFFPNIKNVIDFGCGSGAFLEEFEKIGKIVLGIDFGCGIKDTLLIQKDSFRKFDLKFQICLNKKFDLALCLDVAQAIPEEYSENLIISLVNSSDIIVFSSALPNQGGFNHSNEQNPDYWIRKFNKYNFIQFDILRPYIWDNNDIAWWYKQSIFIFVQQDKKDIINKLSKYNTFNNYTFIHPHFFYNKIK